MMTLTYIYDDSIVMLAQVAVSTDARFGHSGLLHLVAKIFGGCSQID